MKPIEPNPDNGSLADLDEGIRCSPDRQTFVRCHGLKLLLTGYTKEDVARIEFVTMRTIQNWINLWNAGGSDALRTGRRRGRTSKIPTHLHAELCEMLRHPETVDQTYWTLRQLHGYLCEHFALELGYSTLTRFFRRQGFRLKVPRLWPAEQDEVARETFRQQLGELLSDPTREVWFCDETGITGDPRPRRRWAHRKDRIRVPYLGTHIRENIVGAVHPATGQFVSLILPGVDSEVFQLFLDELSVQTQDREILLVLDNASWHKSRSLDWHKIIPIYLPTNSPDLNPIEELWLYIKEHYFRNWIAKTHEALQDRMVWAIQQLMTKQEIVKSVTACENTY